MSIRFRDARTPGGNILRALACRDEAALRKEFAKGLELRSSPHALALEEENLDLLRAVPARPRCPAIWGRSPPIHRSTLQEFADAPGRSSSAISRKVAGGQPRPDLKSQGLAGADQFPLASPLHDVALDGVSALGPVQDRPRLQQQQIAYPHVAAAPHPPEKLIQRVRRAAICRPSRRGRVRNLLSGQPDQDRRNNEPYRIGGVAHPDSALSTRTLRSSASAPRIVPRDPRTPDGRKRRRWIARRRRVRRQPVRGVRR